MFLLCCVFYDTVVFRILLNAENIFLYKQKYLNNTVGKGKQNNRNTCSLLTNQQDRDAIRITKHISTKKRIYNKYVWTSTAVCIAWKFYFIVCSNQTITCTTAAWSRKPRTEGEHGVMFDAWFKRNYNYYMKEK